MSTSHRSRVSWVSEACRSTPHPSMVSPPLFSLGNGIELTNSTAVVGLTRSACIDYGSQGIRINAVAPGFVSLSHSLPLPRAPANPLSHPHSMTKTPIMPEEAWKACDKIMHRVPVGRLAAPAEIANAVVFLSSDKASYITGVTLSVDGGYSAGPGNARFLPDHAKICSQEPKPQDKHDKCKPGVPHNPVLPRGFTNPSDNRRLKPTGPRCHISRVAQF